MLMWVCDLPGLQLRNKRRELIDFRHHLVCSFLWVDASEQSGLAHVVDCNTQTFGRVLHIHETLRRDLDIDPVGLNGFWCLSIVRIRVVLDFARCR
jgi:hypothetical protein